MDSIFTISAGHPSLSGHFPGRPLVPGVVILQQVLARLATSQPQLSVSGIRKLKFLRQLSPEESFLVSFIPVKNGSIRFKCLMVNDNSVLAEGHLSLLV